MQIGPRIRVGGSLGKLGNKAKRVIRDVASNPLAQAALGFVSGGTALPLIAGAVGGGLREHAGFGDVVRGGTTGALAGYAGSKVRSLTSGVRSLLHGGGETADALAGGDVPSGQIVDAGTRAVGGGVGAPGRAALTAPRSALSRVTSVPGRVLNWAEAHPNATAGALQGLGDLATSGTTNRVNDANARLLEAQADETEFDAQRRRQLAEQYQSLWSPLGQAFAANNARIASNPYLPSAA